MNFRQIIFTWLILVLTSMTAVAGVVIQATRGSISTPATATVTAPTSAAPEGYITLQIQGKNRVDQPSELKDASVSYRFQVDKAGYYKIAAMFWAANTGSDSCHWALDNNKSAVVGPDKQEQWQQVQLGLSKLAAGEHTLRFWVRESGLRLSRITINSRDETTPTTTDFKRYPIPPLLPPAGHPRVLARAADLPQLRDRLNASENLPVWEKLQALAAKKISGALPDRKLCQYGRYDENTLKVIEAKAFLYLITGNTENGKDAVTMMKDNFKTASFTDYLDVTRPIGYTIFVGALVYDWCYPLMTTADRQEFITAMERLAGQMEIGYPPLKQSDLTSHGGEAQLLRDLLAAGIAIYDEQPRMYQVAAGRLFANMIPARNFFYGSGRHHQGDSYGPYRFQWDVFSAWLFERMSGKQLYSADMAQVPYAGIYGRTPDGEMIRDGDTYTSGNYWKQPMPAFLCYSYFRDPILKAEFMRQGGAQWALSEPTLFLLFNDPQIAPQSVAELPLTRFSPEPLGAMVCRTGWGFGRNADVVVAEMKGAGYQFNNHQHLDAGAFQIYYHGMLAADLGIYKKYGNDYDWNFNKRSIAHNVMLAYDPNEKFGGSNPIFKNDGGQRFPNNALEPDNLQKLQEKGYRNGFVVAHDFGPHPVRPLYSLIKSDLKLAYSNKLSDYVRSCCFLNLDRRDVPAVMIVFDRMTTEKPEFKKYWQLNSYQKPQLTSDTITIQRNDKGYDGKLVCTSLLPASENRQIATEGGPEHANTVFGVKYTALGNLPAATGWRTVISPRQPAATDLFLNVLQVSAVGETTILQPELIRAEKIVGVAIADRLVTFAADGGLLTDAVTIPVKGGPAVQVLITDLKPGWWSLGPKGSAPTMQHEVKAQTNTLFCVIAPGTYELRPLSGPSNGLEVIPTYKEMKPTPVRENNITLQIAGKSISLNEALPEDGNYKLVPAAAVLSAIGAVGKDSGNSLEVIFNNHHAVFTAGKRNVVINDQNFNLEAAPRRIANQWYLPAAALARFLRLDYIADEIGGGVIMTPPAPLPYRTVWVESVLGSPDAENSPFNTVDHNNDTYWAAKGTDVWLKLGLEHSAMIAGIGISWYNGDHRKAQFEVLTSTDGTHWELAWSGQSDGKTAGMEFYRFISPREARMVMIKGHGNSENQWNSIAEVAILPALCKNSN